MGTIKYWGTWEVWGSHRLLGEDSSHQQC